MSDGSSDIARDQERGELFNYYLFKVKEYILNPNQSTFKVVVEAAEEVDSVRRGWVGETNLRGNIENHLKGLISEDKAIKETEWAKLLGSAMNRFQFQELKALSPFSNNTVVFVNYGMGFVNIKGFEWLNNLVSKAIREQGMKTYDCDDYLVIMPPIEIKPDEIKAIWLSCGISGIEGPRKPSKR